MNKRRKILLGMLGPHSASYQTTLLDGLVAYWKLDEESDGAAPVTRMDSVGVNHLTDVGNTASRLGVIGNGVRINGTGGNYLTIDDNAALSMGDVDFALSAWVWFEYTPSGNKTILSKWSPKTEYWLTYRGSASRFQLVVSSDGTNVTGTVSANSLGVPVLGVLYHIIAWHDSVNNKLGIRVNNGPIDEVDYAGGVYNGTSPFRIGAIAGASGDVFDGLIDEIGVWKWD
jgi:hypothetical protein